ncbi:hypothetical protein PO148_06310 [Limosilactobacillus mucosae]|uniref:Phage capsid protein n=1 Tax=Limosilactobacillus mucosae TaxID=97478 RepID=A0AAJ1HSK8_LIMMU|nr:hypothetical protein [Limosilactobacillus mucosae]MDC2829913.1 hypothetical protein [Limosilactobacillus mucosae]MDC2837369.1 hypothetical protein [Limosilactobacillus mucosae]MDC2849591.1 hypothetical protein [Limosilactobacillus mucosae]MDC2853637.1 hypothetical protein [Limosilactobacillus mucosae]
MAETNLTTTADLVAQSVDFVDQFSEGIQALLSALGVVRLQPMTTGSQIKIYKSEVTKVDGNVAEGEIIPLSKVTRKLANTLTLGFKKYRKVTTIEAIQAAGGVTPAIVDTDNKLLREVQKDVKKDLFDYITKSDANKTTASGDDFQKAMAAALGQLSVKWEDYDTQTVAFANPLDLYGWLGNQTISVQSAFGLQYIQNFLGFNTIILSAAIPQGTIATTVADNINYYYAPISSVGQLFNMTSDETGLIGVTHDAVNNNLSYETVVTMANVLTTERLDGIVLSTIGSNSTGK